MKNGDQLNPESKIMTLFEAKFWRGGLRHEGVRLAVTNGCFDIMHRGHAEYLLKARHSGGALLVLLNSDASVRALKGPSRPVNSQNDRAYMLASLSCVDAVVIFNSSRCDTELGELAPDIYVKGGDYTVEKLDSSERAALQNAGAEFKFIPFVDGFSTTDIIGKIRQS
jgi:rfaE bifunctional protein nucleotidyltransferase chain/domain